MKNINILEAFVKASKEDKLALERILGKETFKTVNYYEILSFRGDIKDNEILKASQFTAPFFGNQYWNIYSIKRLADNQIFTIGDFIDFGNGDKGTLTEINLQDEQTKKLNFISDNPHLKGVSHILSDMSIAERPLFTTDDDVDVYVGTEFYCVNSDYKLETFEGKPFKAGSTTPKYPKDKYFYDKTNALDYIKLHELCKSVNALLVKQNYLCYGELVTNMLK